MKRKIFSKLLMGAFLIASVSMFVSCKDYDDDISANKKAIEAVQSDLQTKVAALQSALDAAKSDFNTKLADYATKAALASTDANVAGNTSAISNNANAIKANADALAALQEALKAYATVEQLNAAVEQAQATLLVAIEGKVSKEAVDELEKSLTTQIATVNASIDAIQAEFAKSADVKEWIAAATQNLATQEALAAAVKAAIDPANASIDQLKNALAALQAAAGTYATKDELAGVSSEAKAALEAAKKELASSKDLKDAIATIAQTYATKDDIKNLVSTAALAEALKNALDPYAKTADVNDAIAKATSDMNSTIDKLLKNYSTTSEAATAVSDAINKALVPYATSADLGKLAEDLNKLVTNINGLNDPKAVKSLTDEVAKIKDIEKTLKEAEATAKAAQTADQVKAAIKDADTKIRTYIGEQINILTVGLSKSLTSVVLKPAFYWEGLEGIEIPTLYRNRVFKDKGDMITFTWNATDPSEKITYKVKENMSWIQNDKTNTLVPVLDRVKTLEGLASIQALIDVDAATNAGYNKIVEKYLYRKLGTDFHVEGSKLNDKLVSISNGGVAQYILNPSKANMEGATYAFDVNVADVNTRAGGKDLTPAVKSAKAENGLLTVAFDVDIDYLEAMYKQYVVSYDESTNKFTWANSNKPTTGNWTNAGWENNPNDAMSDKDAASTDHYGYNTPLPFVSLKATMPANKELNTSEYTVNSDWAVVTPARYENLVLADNEAEELGDLPTYTDWTEFRKGYDHGTVTDNHLWRTAPSAIVAKPTHSVVYNETIDLNPYVKTHADYLSFAKYGESKADMLLDDATLEALGLSYKFTIIDYYVGTSETSESAHIYQVSNGVFQPKSVKSSGVDQKDETRREAVDREPLIRVDLVDKAGNILTYGYIKLLIVDQKPQTYVADIDLNEIYMNCGAEGRVTWAQMEDLILYQLSGGNGLLKKEFETQYYLETQNEAGVMHADKANTIYDAGWQAVRYNPTDAQWEAFKKSVAAGAADASAVLKTMYKYTNATTGTPAAPGYGEENKSYYGNVWYTPHDVTKAQDYDAQTNVIVWNLGINLTDTDDHGVPSNFMNAAKYKKMMNDLKVSVEDGNNKVKLSTVIRFKKKNEGEKNAIYVRLNFNIDKIHFEYAKVANKDLHHWYILNSIKPGTQSDLDTRANTPTPAEVSEVYLTNESFDKDLLELWQNKADIVLLSGTPKAKFSKFYADAKQEKQKVTPNFKFTLPVKGVNSTISATSGTWKVKGISGSVWTLKLDKNELGDNKVIIATQQNGKNITPVQKIVEFKKVLDAETGAVKPVVHYYGDNDNDTNTGAKTASNTNDAATDLLNQMGRRDATGKDIAADGFYLNDNIDKTFTAYIEIELGDDPCYQPLIKDNLFNVRFLRPINVWPNVVTWTDALNKKETVRLSDLVNIVDWRDYPVIAYDSQFGGTYHNTKGKHDKWDKAIKFEEGLVPYEFYGITDLAVIRDEIRSDAWSEYSVRAAAPVADPVAAKFPKIDLVSSLTSSDYTQHFLKVFDGNGNEVDRSSTPIYTAGKADYKDFGYIEYTNNGANAQIFHIYVPIAIKYNWGNIKNKYTNEDKSNIDKTLDYTQTIWAVITVNKTINDTGDHK